MPRYGREKSVFHRRYRNSELNSVLPYNRLGTFHLSYSESGLFHEHFEKADTHSHFPWDLKNDILKMLAVIKDIISYSSMGK